MSTLTLARQIGLDDRNDGLSLTKNSLTRSLRTDTTRRIASSSSSDTVTVTSACLVPYHPTPDSPTFILCALNDASLCLINTTNLAKTYFFDEEVDAARPESSSPTEPSRPPMVTRSDFMSVSCACAGDPTSGLKRLVAYVFYDGWVRAAPLNVADATEIKKLSRDTWSKVMSLPEGVHHAKQCATVFAVSPFSPKVLVLVSEASSTQGCATMEDSVDSQAMRRTKNYAAVLSLGADGTTSVLAQWMPLAVPLPIKAASRCLDWVVTTCWLSDTTLLYLWSSGSVVVLRADCMEVTAQASLFEHCRPGHIQSASVAVSKRGDAALIAVVVEQTILLTYTAQVEPAETQSPAQKRSRTEGLDEDRPRTMLTLTPSPQSFCAEDILITDVRAFYAFSWIVAVTLESGAVVFVDAMSMDVLCHKPIARVAPILRHGRSSTTSPHGSQFTLVQEKPLMLAAFDHNTATFSKSH